MLTHLSLECPSGPVPLNSPFYIDRPPIEELAYQEISKPGSIIRIKAPKQMGKTSLVLRLLARAQRAGYRTVYLDFQQADEAVFATLDKFLRWFCANVSRQLQLQPMLDDYWDEDMGSKVSCTIYFQAYLLEQIDSPLVLALNEVNRIFEYPKIAQDFLALLRSWYEQGKYTEILQKLRLVIVYSTEVYISFNINQSPFNVGLPIKLPEFSLEQVQDLARRHELDWTDGKEATQLMAMVGGHPYLISLAFYHLLINPLTSPTPLGNRETVSPLTPLGNRGSLTPPTPLTKGGVRGLEQLLREAPTLSGIYSNHLRSQWATLKEHPELAEALKQVVTAPGSVCLEAITAYKLESMGLVKLDGAEVRPSCELYRLYFKEQLLQEPSLGDRIKKLEQENQQLQRLSSVDDLTQLANRRSFDQKLEQVWQQLARKGTPLSLILCDIDYFKFYNQAFGHLAGDFCLQQVARAIREVVSRPVDFLARYGGEEFAVLLPQMDADSALQVAEEIRVKVKSLAIPFESPQFGGLPASVVTVSLGVASTIPNPESAPAILVNAVDEALLKSKRQGRDCLRHQRS
jgi:diguanylate cyclase (GGDEF)-like protein